MARAAGALTRIVQQDFSGGMFPELAPELIPPNGAFDITNGLLNEQNVVYRRGGSSYLAQQPLGGGVRMFWTGYLAHGGLTTIIATGDGMVYKVAKPLGGGVSDLTQIVGVAAPSSLIQPTVFQGRLYFGPYIWDGTTPLFVPALEYAAVAGNRIARGEGHRIVVSDIPATEGAELGFTADNYFSLPEGVQITGMVGWRQSIVVFTTEGIWLLGGLAHKEIVDANGNVQWSQDRYSADATLWAQPGVAAWKGGLVVPCRDDVWLMELGVSSEKNVPFRAISQPIRHLYRGYVAAGYKPGAACVYNGHYFLPILSGESVIDLLVCRLEGVNAAGKNEPAWTHLAGYGAEVAALTPAVNDVEGPLLGATAGVARVLKLGYLEPSAAVEKDANGEAVSFSLTTRSIPTGSLTANTVAKVRLSYRMVAGADAQMQLGYGETPYGAEWGGFNWGEADWTAQTGPFTPLSEPSPLPKADPEGVRPVVWRVGRKVRFLRLKMSLSGSASQVSIRALEVFVRESGRLI